MTVLSALGTILGKVPATAWVSLGGLVVSSAVGCYEHSQGRSEGVLAAQEADSLKALGHRSDSLSAEGKQLEIREVHDTVVLTRWKTQYAVRRDTVLLNLHDTVAVVRFVQAADSTIAACSVLVSDCQARAKVLEAQVAAVSAERDIYKRETPTFLQRQEPLVCSATGVVGLVVGFWGGRHL
jgi:hypothetical protein